MQLETVEPTERTFTLGCQTFENLVHVFALVTAYPQQSAVNETYAGTLSQQTFLDEYDELHHNSFLKLRESVI